VIEVVSAVIVRAGRIFLTQRKVGSDFEFDFESPGGMVEQGENHVTALMRELHEELRFYSGDGPEPIKTVVRVPVFETEFKTENLKRPERSEIRIFFYRVELNDLAQPVGREGQGSGWFNIHEYRNLTLAPGNECARMLVEKEIMLSERGR
jgi:8-oxo-dGTP pyrophosphatase MutT (NUDIX family)